MQDLVERTWQELGYKIRAVGCKVWVRTFPHKKKSRGGLWLSPRQASFYGELPHLVTVEAVVLSAGSKGLAIAVKPGDRIAFSRGHFARYVQLESTEVDAYGPSEEFVGYIDIYDVFGFIEEGANAYRRDSIGASAAAPL